MGATCDRVCGEPVRRSVADVRCSTVALRSLAALFTFGFQDFLPQKSVFLCDFFLTVVGKRKEFF